MNFRRWLAACAVLLVAWSLGLRLTGGVRLAFWGLTLSSRDPMRPWIAGLIIGALAIALDLRARDGELEHLLRRAGLTSPANRRLAASAPVVVAAAALLVAALGLWFGSRTVSGSDSFGYISEAYLWRSRSLHVPLPALAAIDPFRPSDFAPLGYVASGDGRSMVPTYPAGLPLVMAVAAALVGTCGPFWITPVAAGALIASTYALGLRLTGRFAATLAALLLAASPAVLYMLMWPMSDIPAAACWTGAWIAATPRPRSIAAALLAGLAVLIRPNLALLVLVIGWLLAGAARRRGASPLRALLPFGAIITGVMVVVAVVNARLYGSPLVSGYGTASSLYALGQVLPNLAHYARWLFDSQGVWMAAAAIGVARFGRGAPAGVRAAAAAFAILVVGAYLAYGVFDDWWYLRFLLPAYPLAFIALADGLVRVSGLLRPSLRPTATVLLAAGATWHAVTFAVAQRTFELGDGERRYADVAAYASDHLPANAVVFAMQHSGSLRYYAGRVTARYDVMEPPRFAAALEALRARGVPAYAVVEDWERPVLAATAREAAGVSLDRPIAVRPTSTRVFLYELTPRAPGATTATIPAAPARCAAPASPELETIGASAPQAELPRVFAHLARPPPVRQE